MHELFLILAPAYFLPLENVIRSELLLEDALQMLNMALPSWLGGIGVVNPIKVSDREFASSFTITKPLRDLMLSQTEHPLRHKNSTQSQEQFTTKTCSLKPLL